MIFQPFRSKTQILFEAKHWITDAYCMPGVARLFRGPNVRNQAVHLQFNTEGSSLAMPA